MKVLRQSLPECRFYNHMNQCQIDQQRGLGDDVHGETTPMLKQCCGHIDLQTAQVGVLVLFESISSLTRVRSCIKCRCLSIASCLGPIGCSALLLLSSPALMTRHTWGRNVLRQPLETRTHTLTSLLSRYDTTSCAISGISSA